MSLYRFRINCCGKSIPKEAGLSSYLHEAIYFLSQYSYAKYSQVHKMNMRPLNLNIWKQAGNDQAVEYSERNSNQSISTLSFVSGIQQPIIKEQGVNVGNHQ